MGVLPCESFPVSAQWHSLPLHSCSFTLETASVCKQWTIHTPTQPTGQGCQQSSALGHSRGQARLKHTTTVPFHSLLHDTLPTSSLSVLLISMSSTPVLCTSRRREREREERIGVEREVRGREREGRREGGRGRQEGRRRLVERVTTAHNSLASLEVTEPSWPQHLHTKGAPPLCPQPASTHPPSPKLPTVRPTICVPV